MIRRTGKTIQDRRVKFFWIVWGGTGWGWFVPDSLPRRAGRSRTRQSRRRTNFQFVHWWAAASRLGPGTAGFGLRSGHGELANSADQCTNVDIRSTSPPWPRPRTGHDPRSDGVPPSIRNRTLCHSISVHLVIKKSWAQRFRRCRTTAGRRSLLGSRAMPGVPAHGSRGWSTAALAVPWVALQMGGAERTSCCALGARTCSPLSGISERKGSVCQAVTASYFLNRSPGKLRFCAAPRPQQKGNHPEERPG